MLACARYIEINPVKAKLVNDPTQWKWSSALSHAQGIKDRLSATKPLLQLVNKNWMEFLSEEISPEMRECLQKHERTGRPLGDMKFIEQLETLLGVQLKLKKAGRKPKK